MGDAWSLNDIDRDADANALQQFEALLSITNILSCGKEEQEKFDAEKYGLE